MVPACLPNLWQPIPLVLIFNYVCGFSPVSFTIAQTTTTDKTNPHTARKGTAQMATGMKLRPPTIIDRGA